MLKIKRSELKRNLGRDWHHEAAQIVEVWLSEAQWATFVSSLNVGSGVTCTIDWVQHEGDMPELPYRNEAHAVDDDLMAIMLGSAAKIQETIQAISDEAGLSQKKKDAMLERLVRLRRDLDDSLPHLEKSFRRHMENTVEIAKTEVAAHTMNELVRMGLAQIGGKPQEILQLGGGDE